jgi:transketolase
MITAHAKLSSDVFSPTLPQAPTREGFGSGVVIAGTRNEQVVVLCADLAESTRAEVFQKAFPTRFIEVGIAEQNMAALAAGLALAGKVPFITSYAAFSPGRNYEHIRTTIALNNVPVKVMGMHAGVSVGPDGATHQMLEDIGLMRMLPGMTVINPCDSIEAEKAVIAAATNGTPTYIRFGRSNVPTFTTKETPYVEGKAVRLWESDRPKVALLSTGSMTHRALLAARALDAAGIGSIVLHVPTIKPLDSDAVRAVAELCGAIVTIEEHQIMGGFGSAVAEYVSGAYPVKIARLGIDDVFGQSGTPEELLEHYGLGVSEIVRRTQSLLGLA